MVQAKEIESLIQFWKDSLAQHRLLMSPSTVYLVDQTINALQDVKVLDDIRDTGLFVVRLNNGDWMAGRASYIYQLDITQDHYADPNISTSSKLADAVAAAVSKVRR